MKMPVITVHLFQRMLHAWVLGFLLTALPVADLLWLDPVSPELPYTGWRYQLVHPLGSWLPMAMAPVLLVITLFLAAWGAWRGAAPLRSALLWFGYTALMHLAFTASSGGQQLIANLLWWSIPLAFVPQGAAPPDGLRAGLGALGLWAIRLQLLLAYLATALHKLTGTAWVDGTAMGIVATDPAFGPAWLAGFPGLAAGLTGAVLAFQPTFPLAVWWRRTRLPWMAFGVLFHGATAVWMDVPEMAFAFLVAYLSWLSDEEAQALLQAMRWRRPTSAPAR